MSSAHFPWLKWVAEALESGVLLIERGGVCVERISGGANNALFRVQDGTGDYACKLCVPDERERARREYAALCLAERSCLPLAPPPILLDEHPPDLPYPLVMYEWLEGVALGPELDADGLAGYLSAFQRMHSICYSDYPQFPMEMAFFHWFETQPYLDELDELFTKYAGCLDTAPDGGELRLRIVSNIEQCKEKLTEAAPLLQRETGSLCLVNVDCNLRNTVLCTDGIVRWVDWEYSGWGDPALELSNLSWHASLLGLTDVQHAWLRQNYVAPQEDTGFDERVRAWDTLMAARWPLLFVRALWSEQHGPDRLRLSRHEQGGAKEYLRRLRLYLDWREGAL